MTNYLKKKIHELQRYGQQLSTLSVGTFMLSYLITKYQHECWNC